MGMYCKQVEAYKKVFSNVHVCLYDDLVKDPDTFMKNIYSFLNIKNITNNYEKKYNETIVPKNNILLYLNFIRNKYNFNFSFLPVKIKTKIKEITFQKNKVKIDFETSQYLKNIFRDDIKCLEKLISRDLSRWY